MNGILNQLFSQLLFFRLFSRFTFDCTYGNAISLGGRQTGEGVPKVKIVLSMYISILPPGDHLQNPQFYPQKHGLRLLLSVMSLFF